MTPKLATDYLRDILERAGYRVGGDRLHLLDKILDDCDARLAEEAAPRLDWLLGVYRQIDKDGNIQILGTHEQRDDGTCSAIVFDPRRLVIGEGYKALTMAAYAVERYWNRLRP